MFEVQNKTSCCKDSTKSDESKDIVSEKKKSNYDQVTTKFHHSKRQESKLTETVVYFRENRNTSL